MNSLKPSELITIIIASAGMIILAMILVFDGSRDMYVNKTNEQQAKIFIGTINNHRAFILDGKIVISEKELE